MIFSALNLFVTTQAQKKVAIQQVSLHRNAKSAFYREWSKLLEVVFSHEIEVVPECWNLKVKLYLLSFDKKETLVVKL